MIKIIIVFIFIFQFLVSCGFSPALKVVDDVKNNAKLYYEIKDSSYNARDNIRNILKSESKDEANYLVQLQIIETETAVNIESNGSVVEYRVEALIEYKLLFESDSSLIDSGQTRGFANYDVSSSEYTNALVKKEAEKTAIREALQLMNIVIQSKLNE